MIEALLVVLGLATGYGITSILESVIHEYVSDADETLVGRWRRHPRLLGPLLRAQFSHHVVHHYQTFRHSYVRQFESAAEQERLRAVLLRRGRHGRIIIAGDFGNRLHGEGALAFLAPPLLAGGGLLLVTPPAFALAAIPALLLSPLFSHFVHPYLHMSPAEARERAPYWVRLLLASRYGAWMRRSHFMHHRTGGRSNFNLVLGADLLRGRMRPPSPQDEDEMKALGF